MRLWHREVPGELPERTPVAAADRVLHPVERGQFRRGGLERSDGEADGRPTIGLLQRDSSQEPRPGGVYRVKLTTLGQCTAGRFVEVVPHSRIVFTWGWDPPIYPIPEGSTTVEITLQPEDGGTVLRLRHTGLPNVPEVAQSHGDGWQHYLDRLAMFAEGRELPPDPWRDGAMS